MMNAKLMGLMVVLTGMLVISGCMSSQETQNVKTPVAKTPKPQQDNQITASTQPETGQTKIPESAAKILGTDPLSNDTDGDGVDDIHDNTPTHADTPPTQSTGPEGFRIQNVLVENNYDEAARKDAPDHLEIVLESTTDKDITNMTVYYDITDARLNKAEAYIKPLTGFILKAHETKSIHFDDGHKPGHFRANPNGIYYTTQDELNFRVTVNADGYAAQTAEVKKDAGGAEVPD